MAYNAPITLLCGSTASFDVESGISYRCNECFAVLGSTGMPKQCKELYDMERVLETLKGTKR
jgi:hypothetical protein